MTSKIADPPIAAAVIAPVTMKITDINDLHASLAHSHAATLRETERQMGVEVFGDFISCSGCSGCSAAKRRGMAVTWPAGCRSTRPLDRVFVDLSGKLPTSAGGAQYLIMIVDDLSLIHI